MTGPNYVNDILQNSRWVGAIESIEWLTSILDSGFTMMITLAAFFITSSALLKNIIAGVVASYPKLWDAIHEAHEVIQITSFQNTTSSFKSGIDQGGIKMCLLRLLPDFYELSDLRVENVSPRAYFTVAIPQMVIVVLIGMMIYNGYYRDTMALVCNFGGIIIQRLLIAADPEAVIDKVLASTFAPKWSTSSDTSDLGKTKKGISNAIYSAIVGYYSDIKSPNSKAELQTTIENYVDSILAQVGEDKTNSENYTFKYQVDKALGDVKTYLNKVDGNITTSIFAEPIVEYFRLDTNQHKDEAWQLRTIVQVTKKAKGTQGIASQAGYTLELAMGSSVDGIGILDSSKKKLTLRTTTPIANISLPASGIYVNIGDQQLKLYIEKSELTLISSQNTIDVEAVKSHLSNDGISIPSVSFTYKNKYQISKIKANSSLTANALTGSSVYADIPDIESNNEPITKKELLEPENNTTESTEQETLAVNPRRCYIIQLA